MEKFELSTDSLFVDKLFDLVEFYLDSPAGVYELEGGGHAGLQRPGDSAAGNASVTVAAIAIPPTLMCRAPRPSTSSAEPWQ